uniref:uncharacterized protein LOC104265356 n=1 Tax=Ciona intestinalis TaxID=7719 RepID=UPI000EF4E2BE|nr:uncharacterized protein LOC104265356 [Ciona intestinalis]|eukprot:XP_026696678.1 uncharacterized protein LOC104265356 [Ciona intestinalis]
MTNKPSYSHLTKGLQSVPMVLLRKRISNVKPRITEEKESSKRIRVLLNDQPHLNAITLVVQPNATWRSLMAEVTSKFSMAVQLRRLYTLDGMNITAFKQITTGETYVASVGAFKPDSRLSPTGKPVWKNQQNSKGRRSSDISLLLKQSTEGSYSLDKPLTFYDDKVDIIKSSPAGTKPGDIDTASAADISQSGDLSANNPTDSDLDFKHMPITDTANLSLHNAVHERDDTFRNISFPSNESLPTPPTPELLPQKRSALIVLGGDKVKVQICSDSNISTILQEICSSLGLPHDPSYNLFSENGDQIKGTRELFTTYGKFETFMAEKVATKSQQRSQQHQQTPADVNGMKLEWIFGQVVTFMVVDGGRWDTLLFHSLVPFGSKRRTFKEL